MNSLIRFLTFSARRPTHVYETTAYMTARLLLGALAFVASYAASPAHVAPFLLLSFAVSMGGASAAQTVRSGAARRRRRKGAGAVRACEERTTMAKVAFLGLGVMGGPMAGHLAKKGGHDVTVYNRTTPKAEAWVKTYGGAFAPTPRQAAEGAEIVFACVGNDDDLRSVVLGDDGALAGMKPGAVFVDHTTASAEVARELAAAAEAKGLGFIDAPVSGGQAGAENGVLTVMCGGDAATYAKVEGAIGSFARACRLMGPAGAGQLTKMVNQICIAGLVQGLSEGVHFAKRAGLGKPPIEREEGGTLFRCNGEHRPARAPIVC